MASKMKISLAWQMMIGLAVGVIVGAMVDAQFAKTYFQPLGTLFIRLIRMVVVPLVLATIIAGAAGILALTAMAYFAFNAVYVW